MNQEKTELEILREKIANLVKEEGYEIEEIETTTLHNSKLRTGGHYGGITAGEIKLKVVRKYGLMAQE